MRLPHVLTAEATVTLQGKSPHVQLVVIRKGNTQMFVRAVWRLKRLVDIKQTLREMDVPTTRDALGLSGKDFQKMTRGLFDR
jgi:hypothetical protein